jgi:hypothetical protein
MQTLSSASSYTNAASLHGRSRPLAFRAHSRYSVDASVTLAPSPECHPSVDVSHATWRRCRLCRVCARGPPPPPLACAAPAAHPPASQASGSLSLRCARQGSAAAPQRLAKATGAAAAAAARRRRHPVWRKRLASGDWKRGCGRCARDGVLAPCLQPGRLGMATAGPGRRGAVVQCGQGLSLTRALLLHASRCSPARSLLTALSPAGMRRCRRRRSC